MSALQTNISDIDIYSMMMLYMCSNTPCIQLLHIRCSTSLDTVLFFLCSLWVDVSVDHSSDWVRGVYDGVRNLVRFVTIHT